MKKKAAESVLLLDGIEEFLSTLNARTTGRTYRYALGVWAIFLQNRKIAPDQPQTWQDTLIADYHIYLKQHYVMSTISLYISAALRYLRYLDAHDRLNFRVDKALSRWYDVRGGKRFSASAKIREADPNVPKIIAYYDELELPQPTTYRNRLKRLQILRARAVVHTLYASAGRASELASLTREALRDGRLSECTITGKGGKDRTLFLSEDAQQAIFEYCKERTDSYPALFISHGRSIGTPLNRGTIWSIVHQAANALGIEGFAGPHAFRHFRAQQLLDNDMQLDVLQAYLGHSNIATTRRVYAPHTSDSKIRTQLQRAGKDAATAIREIPS